MIGNESATIPVDRWVQHEHEVGELRAQMEVLSVRLSTIQWMFGLVLVLAGAIVVRVWI